MIDYPTIRVPSEAAQLAAKKPRRRYPFRTRLREYRHDLGLTLKDVAGRVGLTISHVSLAEKGGAVSLKVAFRLARFYGKKIDDLWGENPEG